MSAVQTCHRLLPDTDCNVNSNDRCGSLALPEFARRYPRILVPHGPHLILLYEKVIEQFLIFMPLCKAVFPTGSGIMGCREDVPSAPGRIGCGAGITLHTDEKLMIGNEVNWMPDRAMHKTNGTRIKAEGEEIRMQAAKSDHHHKSWRFGNRLAR